MVHGKGLRRNSQQKTHNVKQNGRIPLRVASFAYGVFRCSLFCDTARDKLSSSRRTPLAGNEVLGSTGFESLAVLCKKQLMPDLELYVTACHFQFVVRYVTLSSVREAHLGPYLYIVSSLVKIL